jgi:starch-binding outer membrane protein, SusD/RagB family
MKTLYKIFGVLSLTSLFLLSSGCEDFLNRYPDNALTEAQIYADVKDAETAVIAVYDLLSEGYLLGRNTALRGSLKGADFFHFTENPNKRFDTEYKYVEISSSAGYAGYLWNYAYKTIASCNQILWNLENLEGDEVKIKDLQAQVLAAKAICYLELTRAFCYPLWMANDDNTYSMGVPLLKNSNDNSSAIENPPTRASLQDSFDYIIELLSSSLEIIDDSRTGSEFITEQGVWAMLARVYQYTENWELAKDAAIMAESLGGSMSTSLEFIPNMTTRFNDESIFEIFTDENDNLGTSCLAYYAFKSVNAVGRIDVNSIGYGDYGASNAFKNLFSSKDIRLDLFKEDKKSSPSSLPGEAGYSDRAYHKFIGIESELIHNVAYIRLPEVLLIAAEAYSEMPGNDVDALMYLNKVFSARADSTLTGLSGQSLKNEIFNERRRELALEGHELYDYLRKGRSFTRDASHPSPLTIDPVNGRNVEKFHRVVYPIPQPEMDANPNIRNQQNPGYSPYQGGE